MRVRSGVRTGVAFTTAALLLPAACSAQLCPPAPRTVQGSQAAPLADVRWLAADALEGRAAGNEGGRCAAEYLAASFAAIGRAPAANGGSPSRSASGPSWRGRTASRSPAARWSWAGRGRPTASRHPASLRARCSTEGAGSRARVASGRCRCPVASWCSRRRPPARTASTRIRTSRRRSPHAGERCRRGLRRRGREHRGLRATAYRRGGERDRPASGSDPVLRDEVVIVGAHFDHLGRGGEGSRAHSRTRPSTCISAVTASE